MQEVYCQMLLKLTSESMKIKKKKKDYEKKDIQLPQLTPEDL